MDRLAALRVLALLLGLAVAATVARGQTELPGIGSGGAVSTGRVAIELADQQFGVGAIVRPGGWAGVRLRITDSSPEPREILLRAQGYDPDGDRPMYELVVAASAAASRDAWLYLKLPPDFSIQDTLTVEAFEAVATDNPRAPYRAGEFLGRSILAPRMVLPPTDAMVGLVHRAGSMGLNQYSVAAQGIATWSPLGHERTEVVEQLEARGLPDRWMGLMPFETLVWGSENPADLGTERPRALIEWVRRGGHLVIVLPTFTQAWTDARSNPLSPILPRVTIEPYPVRADLNELLPLLAGDRASRELALPPVDASQIVRTFRPDPDARPGEAVAVLNDRAGRALVVRRIEGLGMVTLVGVDLSAPAFRRFALPQADAFWNRVLGRRYEYRSEASLSADASPQLRNVLQRNRAPEYYDDDVRSEIATSGRSAAGLLLAFIVFSLYWLVAGPLGFGILKRAGWTRHAWVTYLGAAAAFTAIAWSGAFALRPKRVEARHLSIIDHVYGQGVQRTRSWMSVLVPWYGEATLRIGDDGPGAPGGERFHNTIAPWSPREAGIVTRFPDVRPYRIDARRPDEITFPTRATVKQLQADWAGEPLADWRMPRPVLRPGEGGEPQLALIEGGRVEGVLRHELPAALEDVYVIAVSRQIRLGASGGQSIAAGWALKRADAWAPGQDWDLSQIDQRTWEPLPNLLDALVPPARRPLADTRSPLGVGDHLTGMSLFHHLDPPQFSASSTAEPVVARRWQAHGWDLSSWLSQPVILVIGHMRGAEMPTPVRLGAEGRAFPTSGHVMVRWVYPLEANPPSWPIVREDDLLDGEPGERDAAG